MKRKKVFRWLKVLLLLYGVIGIAVYYLQDTLLFHPVPVDKQTVYHFTQPYNEVDLNYNKETNLNIIQFRSITPDTPRGVVLIFMVIKRTCVIMHLTPRTLPHGVTRCG